MSNTTTNTTTTFANRSGAVRKAKALGLDLKALHFSANDDGRWGWEAMQEVSLQDALDGDTLPAKQEVTVPAASTDAPKKQITITIKAETGIIPKATIKGQGSLNTRKHAGAIVATKAGRVREIIKEMFNLSDTAPNAEACIVCIQQQTQLKRGLARTYFANNLPKVFPNYVLSIEEKA